MNTAQRADKARSLPIHAHADCAIRATYAETHRLAGLSQNLILLCNQFADELAGKGHRVLAADFRERAHRIVRAKQKAVR